MNWINKIAFYQNIRNEIPNQQLAKELADKENHEGIKEISNHLFDKNSAVSSDCIKVMYEIGYLKPELIQNYVDVFIALLESKKNRMVWGGMIALSTIAGLRADDIYKRIDLLTSIIKKGSVITEVAGIKTLVNVAASKKTYKDKLMPFLYEYLEKCRPIDFATRVETLLSLIDNSAEKEVLGRIIEVKTTDLSDAQKKKLKTVMNKFSKLNK